MTDVTTSTGYDEHRKECEEIFMKTSNFYKSIISGVVILIGILSGSVAFAISSTAQSSWQDAQIQSIEKRVNSLEQKIDGIDLKLDKIYNEVKTNHVK